MSTLAKTYVQLLDLVRRQPPREELHYLLDSADPRAPLAERVLWLERLLAWIRTASPHRHDFDASTGQLHNARIRFLLHLLDRNAPWRDSVSATLRSLVKETTALRLFTDVGIGRQRGFIAEASDRLVKGLLPRPAAEQDLSELFLRIFRDAEDSVWVSHLPPAIVAQIIALVSGDDPLVFAGWRRDMRHALPVLGARIGSLGTLPEVLDRMHVSNLSDLPFLQLNRHLNELALTENAATAPRELFERCLSESAACRAEIDRIYATMETYGVSVALVYTLENLVHTTHRADLLVRTLMPPEADRADWLVNVLAKLVGDRLSQRTLRDLLKANVHLVARKIVERAGASGEDYITRTRAEYYKMLRKGLGGGGIMVGTTLVKFFIGSLSLALFFEGLFYSINYASGFVLLQLLGFTLATKQPSATAAAIAGKLSNLQEEGEVREFVNEVCRTTRTQFAALMGNLGFLIPLSFVVDFLSYRITGQHCLSPKTAQYVLGSLDPLHSFTIPAAALTGVFLWASSIAAGWLENWVVFRGIPEGIATNRRLIQVFGASGARKIGDWTLKTATLWGGNISLGFFLGFTAVTGRFLGIPFDIRHVTLAAASLTLAISSLAGQPTPLTFSQLALPITGIVVIGLLNFLVSYALALAVAVRARDVKASAVRRLLRAVRVRFRNHPTEFFYPPVGRSATIEVHSSAT